MVVVLVLVTEWALDDFFGGDVSEKGEDSKLHWENRINYNIDY